MSKRLMSKLILPLVIMIAAGIYIFNSERNQEMDETPDDQLFISYTMGGEMDVYQDGDRYGYKIEITDNGNYTLYRRFYKESNGERSIVDSLHIEGALPQEKFQEIKSLASDSEFSGLANRLPKGSPREIEMRTPAESVSITVHDLNDGQEHTVRANMGADRHHYPDIFNDLNNTLRSLVRDKLESE